MHIKRGLFFLFVVMIVCIPPACAIQHDGVLKYDAGDSGKIAGTYGMRPWGHAVLFRNTDAITITGIQVYGCKFGTGDKDIFVMIWDKDLKQLSRDVISLNDIPVGQVDVSQDGCGAEGSWADIPLPGHAVTSDFYVTVFTYSPKPSATTQGLKIGYTRPSSTATSHTVTENPNKIAEITIGQQYDPTTIDWMIRTYYTKTAATTAGTTVAASGSGGDQGADVAAATTTAPTVTTLAQQNTAAAVSTVPAVSSPSMDPASAAPAGTAESTKAGIGASLVVTSLVISVIFWKRH